MISSAKPPMLDLSGLGKFNYHAPAAPNPPYNHPQPYTINSVMDTFQCKADTTNAGIASQIQEIQAGIGNCSTLNGTRQYAKRCRRRTALHLPYCWQHVRKIYGVEVKPSQIAAAGKGLFTLRYIPAHKWIAPVGGRPLNNQQMDQIYGPHTAPYAIQAGQQITDDGALRRYEGHYANSRPGNQNCILSVRQGYPAELRPWLKSNKNIQPGSELYTSYGNAYGPLNHPGITFNTI